MADNSSAPNVRNMVSDPQFKGLPSDQQREALFKLTKDSTFNSLSDADTTNFVSRMAQTATPQVPTGSIGAYHPSISQRVGDFFSPLVEHLRMGGAAQDERLLAPEKRMTPERELPSGGPLQHRRRKPYLPLRTKNSARG